MAKKYRDAKSGEYVTEEYALANPDTTVGEEDPAADDVPQPVEVESKGDKKAKDKQEEAVIVADDSVTVEPVKVLEDWQQRVVDEKAELDKKLAALATFQNTQTHNALPREERDRLVRQRRYMEQYSQVLNERVTAFYET